MFPRFRLGLCARLKSYSKTVLVPTTDFPQQIKSTKRCERDQEIEKAACFGDHYSWQREHNDGPEFIFHDGPPYANGDTHLGHAVNKVLKDITTRYQSLSGRRVHYVPGWDCHGLPIEVKAISSAHGMSPVELRQKARAYAVSTIEKQMASFKHWGIMADWTKPYRTFDPHYVARQLQAFHSLYEKGYIFQDYKPVYWSPSNRTALAEAELEYNPSHESWSLFVAFTLGNMPDVVKGAVPRDSTVAALIWTTTPWTLPANQAICYSERHEYCIVTSDSGGKYFILACDMLSQVEHHMQKKLNVVMKFQGHLLGDATYLHPLHPGREHPMLPGHHVTMDRGTGLVHSAPNHGLEDHQNALKHGLTLDECLVDERGCFTASAGDHLSGKEVLGTGSEEVMKLLSSQIEHTGRYVHSYPYDWRSKRPVIVRSSRQWFINLDQLRQQAIECLRSVDIRPESARAMFVNQLEQRPHWCISRQRHWGVPIPVLFRDTTPITSKKFVDHVCDLVLKEGTDIWWTAGVDQLLTQAIRDDLGLGTDDDVEKGGDIMDIWLDSGLSWMMVLPESKQADIYLEGSDQIRGWFQSSLITSVALRNQAPYRQIFLHGFTLDSEGRKMSKSLGNVVDPRAITHGGKNVETEPPHGVDVLRWWVASHASDNDNITVAKHVISECHATVAKLRNTLRFCLGALQDFMREAHLCDYEDLMPLDQYMLHLLHSFHSKVASSYEALQYNHACSQIQNFVVNDVSSFYFQAVKDRLYCDAFNSLTRRSCQTVLSHVLDVLAFQMAPIVPHLCEEAFLHHPEKNCGVFRRKWQSIPQAWERQCFEDLTEPLRALRDAVNKTTANSNVKQHDLIISAQRDCPRFQLLHMLQLEDRAVHSGLTDALQVASVTFIDRGVQPQSKLLSHSSGAVIIDEGEGALQVTILPTKLSACDRCRRHVSQSAGQLCKRCDDVVEELQQLHHVC